MRCKRRDGFGAMGLAVAAAVAMALAAAGAAGAAEKPEANKKPEAAEAQTPAATPAATPYDVEKAPWPCWRGPYYNGTAPDQGIELVDDISKAKLVWVSDQPVPGAYPSHGGVGYWIGGYCTPVVAEGRVTIAYARPPGRTAYQYTDEDLKYRVRSNRMPNLPDQTADDVIHCFDSKTGKTLWQRVFSRKGRLAYDGNFHLQACYAEGRIYMPGSAGMLYCVDAATGEPVWEADYEHDKMQDGVWKGGYSMGAPQVVDGVVVLGHLGNPYKGYDAKTGEQLWAGPATPAGRYSQVIVWMHQGKGYFLAAARVKSKVGPTLIEPKTGKVLWTASMPHDAEPDMSCGALVVSGNHLVLVRMMLPVENDPKSHMEHWPVCFEISPTAAKVAWIGPGIKKRKVGSGDGSSPIIYRDRVYVNHDGTFSCYALEDGTLLGSMPAGRTLNNVNGTGHNSLAVEGRLLISCFWNVAMVNADPKDLRLLGDAKKEWPDEQSVGWRKATCVSLGYQDGFIYMRTAMGGWRNLDPKNESRLVCYDLRAGAK